LNNDHLSSATLSALADGELAPPQLAAAADHLAACPACTSAALAQTLLKSSIARAGQRYSLPSSLHDRMVRLAAQPVRESAPPSGFYGWAAACALLLVGLSVFLFRAPTSTLDEAAEATDQHIATLAADSQPQVVSSDRHTVKPWFQGKIPFSFNLPQNLPPDTALDGANLTYLHGQPAAQLLFSIGRHRVSVFVQQSTGASAIPASNRAGFHSATVTTGDLQILAVSDVEPARLAELVNLIAQAQPAPK